MVHLGENNCTEGGTRSQHTERTDNPAQGRAPERAELEAEHTAPLAQGRGLLWAMELQAKLHTPDR